MFISQAFAQAGGAPAQDSGWMSIGLMVLMFIVFWFLLIRPNQKKMKEHAAMVAALQKGEEVVTSGGIIGRISKVEDQMITLAIAKDTEVLIQRGTVSQLLPKGTIRDF
ncbi:MAG: preprotein translocase subunit YajC [Burkholderiales bacterium]|nr:preprotein translocase subunit YajC [Burkholderiales bacterium]